MRQGHGRGPGHDEQEPRTADGISTVHDEQGTPQGEPDELALRRMLKQAVREIEPGDDALERLRHAVPARRARRRQAVVGMAAAALFIGTAVPALVHVAGSQGDSDARPSIAGNSEDARHDTEPGPGSGGSGGGGQSSGKEKGGSTKPKDKKGKEKDKGEDGKKGGATAGETGGPEDPSGTEAASSPVCEAAQLAATGNAGTAEENGRVYGTFRVVNTSGSSCTVEGAGAVTATAQGAADPAKITVVDHTAGDASGLPDPATEISGLVLKPGAAYEVRFAWVPSPTDSCPVDPGPSPDPTPTEGGGDPDGNAGGGDGGVEPQLEREEGGTLDGSVAVSLTAEPGAPSASATVPGACAGTIYRTGVLAGS